MSVHPFGWTDLLQKQQKQWAELVGLMFSYFRAELLHFLCSIHVSVPVYHQCYLLCELGTEMEKKQVWFYFSDDAFLFLWI